jgi:multiple sugar transport system substrate-binding protein
MKKLSLALVVVSLAVVFTGCQKKESGYIRFAWWGNATRDERTIKVTQLFMEQNQGVTIETESTGWDGYWPKMNTQAAAGSLPDIMQQDYAYIEQYNNRNQLLDLNSYVQKGIIDVSDWSESSLASGRMNGKLIALSLGTNAWGMGVDPAVLEKAGVTIDDIAWTWKDYEQIALTIFRQTGVQTMPFNEFQQPFEHIVRQFGVPFFGSDQKRLGVADHPDAYAAVKEVIDMQLRLRAAGALYDPEDAFILSRAMEEYPISRGRTWNNFHWSNQHVGVQNASRRPLEYLMFPSVKGNEAPFGTYLKPAMFISILSSSENKDLAAHFVNFILNDLEANRILMADRGIPASSAVREDLADRVDANLKYLFDFITKVTPYTTVIDAPDPPTSGEVRDVMRPILLSCLMGRLSSDAAMTQMVQAANAVLGR